MVTWDAGFPEWETKLRCARNTLCVLTEHPGQGKTTIAVQIVFDICQRYRLKAAIASSETGEKHYRRRNIRAGSGCDQPRGLIA
jgi:replicative DNA helicase